MGSIKLQPDHEAVRCYDQCGQFAYLLDALNREGQAECLWSESSKKGGTEKKPRQHLTDNDWKTD